MVARETQPGDVDVPSDKTTPSGAGIEPPTAPTETLRINAESRAYAPGGPRPTKLRLDAHARNTGASRG